MKNEGLKNMVKDYDNIFNKSISEISDEVVEIELEKLHDFTNHPYKVINDRYMEDLVNSIRENGVVTPAIVRKMQDGEYELISGHRRKHACEILNIKKMPVTVKNYTDDEAAVIMVDSNIQREEILPSEKAKAFKIKYDALKHMGKGNRLELMQEHEKENAKTIQRYIWMANLNDELLEMVDKKLLKGIPAVNISFLTEVEQNWLVNVIKRINIYPGLKESEVLKQKSKNNELTEGDIWEILSPEVKNKPRKITIKSDRLNYYFPETYTETEIESIIIELLDDWKSQHKE